jgi:hypothetical protein
MTTFGNFDQIEDFFSAYFHQDWPEEAKDPAQVISLYLAQRPGAEVLRGLAQQIRRFMDSYTDDDELEHALFSELGCYYQPSADKVSARAWLQDVACTLAAAAKSTES